jgi:hypothetical protein
MDATQQVIERTLTSELKRFDPEITWEAEESPIYLSPTSFLIRKAMPISGYKAILRNDDQKVLAVCKDSYTPMSNSDFMTANETIARISGFEFLGYAPLRGGRIMLGYLKNNRDKLFVRGHEVGPYMVTGNSFDGSHNFFVGSSAVMYRCTNMFSSISRFAKVRHSKGIDVKMEELYQYLEFYMQKQEEIYTAFNLFSERIVSPEVREAMKRYILDVESQEKLDKTDKEISTRKNNQLELLDSAMIREAGDLGNTMWGLFNGATRHTTHNLRTKYQTFGNVYGMPAELNTRAFEFANAFANTGELLEV